MRLLRRPPRRNPPVVLVAIATFRDEDDVAYHTLDHLASEGVDAIIVTDHLSGDNTRAELNRAKKDLSCPVLVLEDNEFAFRQSARLTALAALARKEFGATWILPFAADELWHAENAPLKAVLQEVPRRISAVETQLFEHRATGLDPAHANPFLSIVHRHPNVMRVRRIICRWHRNLVIGEGAHHVCTGQRQRALPSESSPLRIRHFHRRTFERFVHKARVYSAARDAAGFGPGVSQYWRHCARLFERGEDALRSEWEGNYFFPNAEGLVRDPAPFKRWALEQSL